MNCCVHQKKWLIASRSQRTLNHNCVPNTWWSAHDRFKQAQTATTTTSIAALFTFCFSLYTILFFLFYLPGPAERVVVYWGVLSMCVCFASYLMVMVGVRVALYCIRSCYALDFACACAFFYSFVLIPFLVLVCLNAMRVYIQTARNRHLHGNRLWFRWCVRRFHSDQR